MRGQPRAHRPASVLKRLTRALTLIGITGTLLLFVAIILLYHFSIVDLTTSGDYRLAFRETMEHVVLPVAVLMGPVAFVVSRAIRQAFAPLLAAAREIEQVRGHQRGFRINTSHMPLEAIPFTDAVNDLLARLDEAAGRHEAFAADVAHELRTPLSLLALELDSMAGEGAARMRADVMAMRRLIDQLLLLAQLDAAEASRATPEPVALNRLAAEVVALLAPAVIADGRSIELDHDAGDPVVPGRREAIAAALRNLVENAARVTPEGGTVRVRVGPGAAIGVFDEGPGLSSERLRQLARRHSRADHASSDGAGLGLAIVERIMEAHGGRLLSNEQERRISLCFAPKTDDRRQETVRNDR